MRYAVRLAREAEKDLLALSRANRRLYDRILNNLESLADDPGMGKPLAGHHKGEFSLRVGDWRIIYETHTSSKTVFVLTVKHRRHAY
jgi:mRNA interferase RelE/StbE